MAHSYTLFPRNPDRVLVRALSDGSYSTSAKREGSSLTITSDLPLEFMDADTNEPIIPGVDYREPVAATEPKHVGNWTKVH